jgi:hypothetical protein
VVYFTGAALSPPPRPSHSPLSSQVSSASKDDTLAEIMNVAGPILGSIALFCGVVGLFLWRNSRIRRTTVRVMAWSTAMRKIVKTRAAAGTGDSVPPLAALNALLGEFTAALASGDVASAEAAFALFEGATERCVPVWPGSRGSLCSVRLWAGVHVVLNLESRDNPSLPSSLCHLHPLRDLPPLLPAAGTTH